MDNYEYTELLKELQTKMDNITGVVEPDKLQKRLKEIEELENSAGFWNDAANAAKVQKEKTQLERKLEKYNNAKNTLDDAIELYEMAKEEGDEETIQTLFDEADVLKNLIRTMEIEVLLSGEQDTNNAILSIHPGAGGTESQDWASMLLRMYKRYAERRGWSVEVLDYQVGEEAGIKDASILIKGENAYGYLFSSVMVSPEIDDNIDITIEDKDIRIDTYRASGAGGQHVNKTESAIRITHIPTGIVVQCQNDRSQHKNKATAMKMLKSRLYELKLEEQKAEADGIPKSEIGWKDNRSNEAYSNVSAILDGDLDKVIEDVLIAQNKQ